MIFTDKNLDVTLLRIADELREMAATKDDKSYITAAEILQHHATRRQRCLKYREALQSPEYAEAMEILQNQKNQ